MRHRNRYSKSSDQFLAKLIPPDDAAALGAPVQVLDLGQQDRAFGFETIIDIVGNRNSMNPCSHTRVKLVGGTPIPPRILPSNEDVRAYTIERPFWVYSGAHQLPSPSAAQLNDFAWDSYLNAIQQVPEKIDLPNFLRELGDMRDVFKSWGKQILEWIASGFLHWNLSLKPFLGDLQKLASMVKDARKRLKFLRKTYGKPTTIHMRRETQFEVTTDPWEVSPRFSNATNVPDFILEASTLQAKVRSKRCTLYSTIVTYHELGGLDSATALLDTLAAMTGLQNPIRSIWNAIPFSFVLEYLVSLDSMLKQCQLAVFDGEIRLLDACWSVKAELMQEAVGFDVIDYFNEQGERQPPLVPIPVGMIAYKRYVRSRGLPLGSSVFLTDGLSSLQLGILAALAYMMR